MTESLCIDGRQHFISWRGDREWVCLRCSHEKVLTTEERLQNLIKHMRAKSARLDAVEEVRDEDYHASRGMSFAYEEAASAIERILNNKAVSLDK